MNQLQTRVNRVRTQLQSYRYEAESLERRLKALKAKQNALKAEHSIVEEAISLASKCLEENSELVEKVESIVTTALQDVFGSTYKFVLEKVFTKQGNLKGVRARISSNGVLGDPLDCFGAGVQAVCSLALRVAFVLLSDTENLLILDEPLSNLSPKLWPRLSSFLGEVSDKTGLQIIMVTHSDEPVGTLWEVSKVREGKEVYSVVTKVGES